MIHSSNIQLLLNNRLTDILRRASAERIVKVKELSESLGVHPITIRRDLDQLAEGGYLERIHGGAKITDQASLEIDFQLRETQQSEAKKQLAAAAYTFIREGDTIALDPSTTVIELAKLLHLCSVTAITAGLDASIVLSGTGVPHIHIGGSFDASSRSYAGPVATTAASRLHPDTAFFSAKGFTPQAGFTDPNIAETEVTRTLILNATRRIALIDHTKLGKTALSCLASVDEIDAVILDREPEPDMRNSLEEAGAEIIIAAES